MRTAPSFQIWLDIFEARPGAVPVSITQDEAEYLASTACPIGSNSCEDLCGIGRFYRKSPEMFEGSLSDLPLWAIR